MPNPTGKIVALNRLINTRSGNVRHRVTLHSDNGGLHHFNTAPDAAIGAMITNHLHTHVTLVLNHKDQVIGAIPTPSRRTRDLHVRTDGHPTGPHPEPVDR